MPTLTGTAASETLTGSAGDDVINDDAGGSDILRGLGGNDLLHVYRGDNTPVTQLRLEGGDGDDLFDYYVFNASTAVLDGGVGTDVFRLWAVAGVVQITTGAGADVLDFGRLNPTWGGSLTVSDFTGGVGGDRISWGGPPSSALTFLSNWGGGNPFASGHLQLTQVGADALLRMDLDGSAGSGSAIVLATFLNTQASNLTAWNLGFDPAGGAVPGQTINGTAAPETLQGTAGNDIISGLDGNDYLFGNAGDDQLFGGQGDDALSGGLGDDVLEGGDGDDHLSDAGGDVVGVPHGDDILNGGAGNDYISVSRWNQTSDVLTLVGGAGSDEFRVIGDDGFSATLDGGADSDRFYLDGHIRANLTITTGTGADTVHLGMIVDDTRAITVTDFTAGAGGDIINWSSAVGFYLIGWNGYNPFQLGFARLVQNGEAVWLQLDRDGSGGQHDWKTLFIFENTLVAAFTSHNLHYNPLVVPGQLFTGGEADDVFIGTDGNDVMQSGGGGDILRGGAGDDDLQGGSGRDVLIGGPGDDRMDGGSGGEQSTTYVGGVYTGGGDLFDFRDSAVGVTVNLSLFGPQDTGHGRDTLTGFEDVFGGAHDDVITGDRFSPGLIMGNDGDDVLAAGRYLVGGAGDDTLIATFLCTLDGGSGEDTAVFDGARADYVVATGPDGTITLTRFGSLTYVTRDVEILRFSDGLYRITGERLPTVIDGTAEADWLVGDNDIDIIGGGGGDDVLFGLGGDDVLDGGDGVDTASFSGARAAYSVTTSGGVTTVTGPDGTDTLTHVERLWFADATFIVGAGGGQYYGGSDGYDSFAGTAFADQIVARAGDDLINAGAGHDSIDGGDGTDTAVFSGARAGYTISTTGGVTTVTGPDGTDSLTGVERLQFSDGLYDIAGAPIITTINGAAGPDVMMGDVSRNALNGLGGNDILSGLEGNDILNGGDGDDLLDGGLGDDLLNGGNGIDTVTFATASTATRVQLARAADQPTGGGARDTITGVENLTGSAFGDDFSGDEGANVLTDTLGGDDRFIGGAGNDTLILERSGGGAATTSLLRGGLGDDAMSFRGYGRCADTVAFEGQDGNDVISATGAFKANINAGSGNDRVTVDTLGGSFVVKLGSGSDTLVLAGTAGTFGGGSTANLVRDFAAGNGGDVLDLTAYLAGGALTNFTAGSNPFLSGHMRLVQSGADTLVQVDRNGGGNGFVTVLTLQKTLTSSFTAFNFNGLAPLPAPVEGGAGADVLNGTGGIDVLNGNGGDDVLTGGAGNDVLNGGAASDVLDGGAGDDVLNGGSGAQGDTATYASATAGVNVNLAVVGNQQDTVGSGFDSLTGIEHLVGSAFTDELRGDGFANRLTDTSGGDDFLRGEAGDDTILIARSGGGAATTVRLNGGADNDALTFAGNGRYSDTVTLEGEGGNDLITVSGAGTVGIDAGAGADTVVYDTLGGAFRITLGEGSDTLRLAATGGQFAASGDNLVRDFATGAGGDMVDLSAWLAGGALTNYGGGNPFADGHMRLVQNGSRTLLQVDRDGGGNGYQTVLAFTNTTAASFTAANFNGFDPAGLAPMPVESADKALDAGPQVLPGLIDDAFLVLPGETKAAVDEPLVLPGAGLDGLTHRTGVFAFADALPFNLMGMHDRDSLPGGPRDSGQDDGF